MTINIYEILDMDIQVINGFYIQVIYNGMWQFSAS